MQLQWTHVAVLKTGSDGADALSDELGHLVGVLDASALLGDGARALVDEHGTGETSSSDNLALLPADSDVVSDNGHPDRVLRVGDGRLLLCEAKEEDVARVAHDDDERALVVLDELEAAADLAVVGRGKDIAGDGAGEQACANEAGVRGLFRDKALAGIR